MVDAEAAHDGAAVAQSRHLRCPRCETALAEAETTIGRRRTSIYVKFPLKEEPGVPLI